MKVLKGSVSDCPFDVTVALEDMFLDKIAKIRMNVVGEEHQLRLLNDTTITKFRVRVNKGDREGQILTSSARINFYDSAVVRLTGIPFTAMDGTILYKDMKLGTKASTKKISFKTSLEIEDATPLTYSLITEVTYETTR